MRKNLALILALAMVLSLFPITAFAESDNRIVTVQEVQVDEVATAVLEIKDADGDLGTTTQSIRLDLTNSEWAGTTLGDAVINVEGGTVANAVRVSDTRALLDFSLATAGGAIQITFKAEVTGEGEAKINVARVTGNISNNNLVFAVAYDGETAVTVADTVTFGPDEDVALENIIIDELVEGALDLEEKITFKLDRGFEWVGTTSSMSIVGYGAFADASVDYEVTEISGRDLEFTVSPTTTSGIGTLVISGLEITEDGGDFGDVNVVFGGALTSQTKKVAEYADYTITVENKGDVEEVIAGRFVDAAAEEGYELGVLRMKENLSDSWVSGRTVTVELPTGIKITDVVVEKDGGYDDAEETLQSQVNGLEGKRKIEFTPVRDGSAKFDIELLISVVAEADFEGDIVADVTGRGLDTDHEVVLGTVIAPLTVEMEMTEVVIGASSQAFADITITENVAGALMEGWLGIDFDLENLVVQSGLEVEADDDSGLEIDDVERNWNGWDIAIEIDRESDDEPGVVTITGIMVSINRVPATGDYNVSVGGTALVNNNVDKGEDIPGTEIEASVDWFETDYVWEAPMLKVVATATPIATEITFTIGMSAYTVDSELKAMDVSPFIADGRTMIPVRYLEELFGMQPIWNATSRTVTVLYNGMVYEMAIGSAVLRVNGAPFMEMDAQAQIVDSRTFVPASRFARAMGIDYNWDAATQTVTFMK